MISSMLRAGALCSPTLRDRSHASSISPSRSLPYPSTSLFASRLLMMLMSMARTLRSSAHVLRFFSVGRYLRIGTWTSKMVEKARNCSSRCARNTFFPSM
jgi:hypothetical protein